ncbi:hypothetical protein KC351_g13149 [Hortaea werneckii]|nr:hypothetical protein KC351_g13149 [Hortaea werneckii]
MASSTNNIDAGDETIAFKCEECVVNVHGAAVCAKSNVIKAMVDAASTDSSNARTIITGFDPHTVVRMLRYVYDGDYDLREAVELPTASGSVHGKEHPVVSHIRVHAIGKRYEVSGLAALALEKLRCSETYIAAKNFVNVLRVAYQYSAKETDDVRTELFAVALAKMEDLAASQVFLTQLAEFEELRDFAAQLLPHVFKFAAVRYSRSEDSLALKNETIQLLATEASTHNARADIHIEKFCAMREKYEGELIKGERLEKLLTERSNQLEVATAKIACLESAPSQDTAQGDASEAEIFRLQELLKAEQARAARTQTHLDQSDLKSEISRKTSSAKSWYQMQDLREYTPVSAPSSFFMPPSFAEQSYWDQRFRDNRNAFEWLLPPPDVAQLIGDIIRDASIDSPRILHIGAGTSHLSSHLKNLINDSKDVCNTDFSKEAVAVGKALEAEQAQVAGASHEKENVNECLTLWEQSDHLSANDTNQLLHSDGNNGRLFNTIVDKSTSDAISCGLDVEITLPYPIHSTTISQTTLDSSVRPQTAKVHPLHLLAVHLAALTEPGKGRWVVVSYNEDRFPFFSPFVATHAEGALRDDIIEAGFPDPKRLWTLVEKRQVKVPPPSPDGGIVTQARRVVHTPDVFHWVYVLARTDVELTMRDSAAG